MRRIYSTLALLCPGILMDAQLQSATGMGPSELCHISFEIVKSDPEIRVIASGTGQDQGTYIIYWGDGTISTDPQSSHIYTESGDYQICAQYGRFVPGGCVSTSCMNVSIAHAPEPLPGKGETATQQQGGEVWAATVDEEQPDATILAAYPNPLSDAAVLKIVLPHSEVLGLEVRDIVGHTVYFITAKSYEKGTHEIHWDTSSLSNGVYFIRLDTGSQVQTIRAVKR